MESSARKVQAERNRRRLPRRGRAARWARRIVGLVATAVFLGAGVAIALMVVPDGSGEEAAAIAATPTPTATPKPAKSRRQRTENRRQVLLDRMQRPHSVR